MEILKRPVVTVEDVFAGQKEVLVENRKGGTAKVIVNAMSWRTSISVSQSPSLGGATVELLQTCLNKEQAQDEFLDSLIPAHLHWLALVAIELAAGVGAAKKRLSAVENFTPEIK